MFFNDPKTLIVVYTDELYCNYLKKLVETNDDKGEDSVVGTKDGSIHIVAWTDKVWRDQKKAGNINDKVLFLGDIKGTDKLLPILDVKYNEYGILYGWAGNQAILCVDSKALKKDDYLKFFDKLCELSIPDSMKVSAIKEQKAKDDAAESVAEDEAAATETVAEAETAAEADTGDQNKGGAAKVAKDAAAAAGKFFKLVAGKTKEAASAVEEKVMSVPDYAVVQKQQFIFGIHQLYENHLEAYMNN